MKAVTLSAMLLSLWTCVWGRELLWVGGKELRHVRCGELDRSGYGFGPVGPSCDK